MKSQNNQLKSADIGHEFCVLTKTNHVGHVSHSIFVPEFEFDHNNLKFSKTQNFQNLVESAWNVFSKLNESNRIIKNQAESFIHLILGNFWQKWVSLKSTKNQLTLAMNFAPWPKLNIWGMFPTQFWSLSLNLGIIFRNFLKHRIFSDSHQI